MLQWWLDRTTKVILDHQPAVVDTAVDQPLGSGTTLLNPGPLYHNAPS
jgi:bile acid-coenzyme A ligase